MQSNRSLHRSHDVHEHTCVIHLGGSGRTIPGPLDWRQHRVHGLSYPARTARESPTPTRASNVYADISSHGLQHKDNAIFKTTFNVKVSGIVPSRGDLTSKSTGHARSNSAKNDDEYCGRQRGRLLLLLLRLRGSRAVERSLEEMNSVIKISITILNKLVRQL